MLLPVGEINAGHFILEPLSPALGFVDGPGFFEEKFGAGFGAKDHFGDFAGFSFEAAVGDFVDFAGFDFGNVGEADFFAGFASVHGRKGEDGGVAIEDEVAFAFADFAASGERDPERQNNCGDPDGERIPERRMEAEWDGDEENSDEGGEAEHTEEGAEGTPLADEDAFASAGFGAGVIDLFWDEAEERRGDGED